MPGKQGSNVPLGALLRPVAFFWQTYTDPAGLHVETQANVVGPYVREVLAIGNPAIWWVSIPAMAVCLGWWLSTDCAC